MSSTRMQIRVDVDEHIDSSEELIIRVEGVVEGSLDRFQETVARVDVHLSQIRQAAGHRALCCRMEAYTGELKTIAVSHEALTLTEAIHAASAKLQRAVVAVEARAKPGAASGSERDDTAEPEDSGLGHLRSS